MPGAACRGMPSPVFWSSNSVALPQLMPAGSNRTDRRVNQKAAVETRRLFSLKRDPPQPLPPTSRAGRVSHAFARDSRPSPPNRALSPKVSNSLSRAVSRVNDWSASQGRCRHGRVGIAKAKPTTDKRIAKVANSTVDTVQSKYRSA